MKNCHRVLLGIGLLWGALCATAQGQISIPMQVKTAAVLDQPSDNLITRFITDSVRDLAGADAAAQRSARESLISEIRAGTNEPSVAYRTKYSDVLSTAVTPLLTSDDIRMRLNAAIVIGRVAEVARSPRLESATLELLKDDQPAVVKVWGLAAARSILPDLVTISAEKKLLARVVPTVKQNPTRPIVEEAYRALTASSSPKALSVTIDPLLDLLQWRADQYAQAIPEDPDADYVPFNFLMQQAVWPGLTSQQRVKALQAAWQIMAAAAVRGDEARDDRLVREQLQNVVERTAKAVWVAAQLMNEKSLQDTAQRIGSSASSSQAKLTELVKGFGDEIRKIKGFESVQDPALPASAPAN